MYRAKFNAASMFRKGIVASALSLALILGSVGVGSSASAEGPASVFYGYVFADQHSGLAERVRAIGPAGAVCGTAAVLRLSDAVGYYAISVASASEKRGCPSRDGVVQFSLVTGRLDDGLWAGEVAILGTGDVPRSLSLHPAGNVTGLWSGNPGEIERDTWLRWTGEPRLLSAALASLPIPANTIYQLDPESGVPIQVTEPGEVILARGDLLLVRFN